MITKLVLTVDLPTEEKIVFCRFEVRNNDLIVFYVQNTEMVDIHIREH